MTTSRRPASGLPGLLAALLLAACASAPPRGLFDDTRGIDGIACALPAAPPPAALRLLPDVAVPAAAEGASGYGGICRGRVYEVREALEVHRLGDATRASPFGEWWALRPPAGDREAYREAYAVCRKWSALDVAVTCTLQPGTRVVVGSGQSAVCAEQTYPKSPVHQVYLPLDAQSDGLPLQDCRVRPFP